MTTSPPTEPRRGEVWLVSFDPTIGGELNKTRPAVVISSDAIGRLPLRIVVPVTDWKEKFSAFPWFIGLPASAENGLRKRSGADTFQVKSVALERFQKRLGHLTTEQLDDIAAGIAVCVGLRLQPGA